MNDYKLGKAMAPDSNAKSLQKSLLSPSAAAYSLQGRPRAPLAYARSIPRNRIIAVHELEGSSRSSSWQASQLVLIHVERMRAAARFAHHIGYPLNLSIDINWNRTWLGNDPDGQVLSHMMELNRKWLKPRYCAVFAQITVREHPDGRPNAHILVHCPPAVLPGFKRQVRSVLSDACRRLDRGAVQFTRVGSGNATLQATLGKLDYMCKGISPQDAARLGISSSPQGFIYGKRYSISQDIQQAARRRYAEGAEG